MCIVALYASFVRQLMWQDREGELPPDPPTEMIAENRWLAQRYGVWVFLGDPVAGGRMDINDHTAQLVEDLAEDALALGCESELRRTLRIVRDGAGADRQLDHYRLRRLQGDEECQALHSVVELMVSETDKSCGAASDR